jgi:hypothetical protein
MLIERFLNQCDGMGVVSPQDSQGINQNIFDMLEFSRIPEFPEFLEFPGNSIHKIIITLENF